MNSPLVIVPVGLVIVFAAMRHASKIEQKLKLLEDKIESKVEEKAKL